MREALFEKHLEEGYIIGKALAEKPDGTVVVVSHGISKTTTDEVWRYTFDECVSALEANGWVRA